MTKERDVIALLRKNPDRKFSFKELCIAMIEPYLYRDSLIDGSIEVQSDEERMQLFQEYQEGVELITKANPLVFEAFEYLSFWFVRNNNYRLDIIGKKLSEVKISFQYKEQIYKGIEEKFELNKWYTSIEVKAFFTELFKELDIKLVPKSTILSGFYKTEYKKLRINGKQSAGVRILERLDNVDISKICNIQEKKEQDFLALVKCQK